MQIKKQLWTLALVTALCGCDKKAKKDGEHTAHAEDKALSASASNKDDLENLDTADNSMDDLENMNYTKDMTAETDLGPWSSQKYKDKYNDLV